MDLNVVQRIDKAVAIQTVLISVADKRGLKSLVPALVDVNPGVRILSTGGTYQAIAKILGDAAGQRLTPVASYTGQPEMQGGLVKTLDFKIYLGLLSETYNDDHAADLQRTGASPIDMVVSNLYPFAQAVAAADVTPEKARGNIDIGGPCMVRAAAKNFLRVAAVTDPADYPMVVQRLRSGGGKLDLRTRFELARKAFSHTAAYDRMISAYLEKVELGEVESCYTNG